MKVVFGWRRKRACCSREDLLERNVLRWIAIAAGDLDELVEPFVVRVLRLPELERVGAVDQDRDAQPRAGFEDRVEPGIVDRDAPALDVDRVHAETLVDLETPRAGADVRLELGDRARGPAGRTDSGPVDVGEVDDPPGRHALGERQHRAQVLGAPDRVARLSVGSGHTLEAAAREVDHHRHVHRVHRGDDLAHRGFVEVELVVVDVDERVLRARDRMLRHHQRLRRVVLHERERGGILRAGWRRRARGRRLGDQQRGGGDEDRGGDWRQESAHRRILLGAERSAAGIRTAGRTAGPGAARVRTPGRAAARSTNSSAAPRRSRGTRGPRRRRSGGRRRSAGRSGRPCAPAASRASGQTRPPATSRSAAA